jgi:hypothetical protein
MLKRFFSNFFGRRVASDVTDYNMTAKTITSNLVGFVIEMSDFNSMNDEDIYEQFYVHEPAVGSAIDRLSALVRQSFAHIRLRNIGDKLDKIEEKMLEDAHEIYDELELDEFIESVAELLLVQGNVFMHENKDDISYTILPNKLCAWVENPSQVNEYMPKLITNPQYLAFNESLDPKMSDGAIIYPKEDIVHIKYKSTPVFVTDCMGRKTFNVYSVSPLHRTLLAIWWKRQIMALDVLLRWRNVPREQHKLDSELFNLANYMGTPEERRQKAIADVDAHIAKYSKKLENMTPDSNYVTTSNIGIEMIETRNRNVTPTSGNALIDQLDSTIMAGLNIPSSMISGSSGGSYATELMISNYVASKVIHISQKIKPVIMKLLRARLKLINSAYPIDMLDVTLELNLDAQKLNLYREANMLDAMGKWTPTEIREHLGYEALTKDQKEEILKWQETMIKVNEPVNDNFGDNVNDPKQPDTPESDASHSRVGDDRSSADANLSKLAKV